MDPEAVGSLEGWIGGIVGGGLGVLGGLAGTYLAIKNAKSPEERAAAVKGSMLCWVLVIAFAAAMWMIPTWHKHLLWIPYTLLLLGWVRVWNKTRFQSPSEEPKKAA